MCGALYQFVVTPSIRNNAMPIVILVLPIVDTILHLKALDLRLHLALESLKKGLQLHIIQCLIAQVNEAFTGNSHRNTHDSFGHTRGVRFIRPSIRMLLYI